MKVWITEQDYKTSLVEGLSIDLKKHRVIAAVGAGGKTTFLNQLGKELAALGNKVVFTTTTHILQPKENTVLSYQAEEIQAALQKTPFITVGIPCENGKLKCDDISHLDNLTRICDFLLIEADGSRRLPLKAPGEKEPVLPSWTDLVVGIAGASSIGRKLEDVCFRGETAAEILNCSLDHIVTPEDVAFLLNHEGGQKKDVGTKDYRAVLGQADGVRLEYAKRALHCLRMKNVQSAAISYRN